MNQHKKALRVRMRCIFRDDRLIRPRAWGNLGQIQNLLPWPWATNDRIEWNRRTAPLKMNGPTAFQKSRYPELIPRDEDRNCYGINREKVSLGWGMQKWFWHHRGDLWRTGRSSSEWRGRIQTLRSVSWMEIVARPLGLFIYGGFNRNLLRWNP